MNKLNQYMSSMVLLLLLSFLSCGCVLRHVDGVTTFYFVGKVFDYETNLAIEGVTVFFVDTGFDYVRSNSQKPIEITKSNTKGVIKHEYGYWWGSDEGIMVAKPKMTLSVILMKDRYKEKRINFTQNDYIETDKGFKVDLGEVLLKKD